MSAPILIDLPLEKTPAQAAITQTISLRLTGICTLLIFAILSFGAVEEWATAVVELSAAILFLSWVVHELVRGRIEIRPNPLYGPILIFGLVVVLQITFNLTAYRYDSLLSALLYAAYGMVFFVTLQSLNARYTAKTIVWTFTVFGSALAIFAICQDFIGNGKIF